MNRLILLFICLLPISTAYGKTALITKLSNTSSGEWFVEYEAVEPIKSIQLSISPDNSRYSRWQLLNDQFTLFQVNGRDLITRKDNASFTHIKIKLSPTYTHLPKYYAPFAPYSDGGMLVHSARFFACANICGMRENHWYFSLEVPSESIIYLKGKSHYNTVSWWDKNDGTKFYVGKKTPFNSKSYIALVDQGLPSYIKAPMKNVLPKMMQVLEQDYGKLHNKPMMFASYGATTDSQYGRQGGVLPGQIFMHWYGKVANDDEKQRSEILWFFAHEAAHLYQGQISSIANVNDSWLQEGHAEYLAMRIMMNLNAHGEEIAKDKLASAKVQCSTTLDSYKISEAASHGNYQAYYHCGLVIFDHIGSYLLAGETIASLWQDFIKSSQQPHFNAKAAFLSLAKERLPKHQFNVLEQLVK